jgi:glycosyltransferase involved in cell wall biosynthesis
MGLAETHGQAGAVVRVAFITTSSSTLRTFFGRQVRSLRNAGYRVHTISAPAESFTKQNRRLPVHTIPMKREMAPLSDAISLIRLWWLLLRIRPDILHTHTPKAGLLGMIAGRCAGVRVRIFTINGLVWSTRSGWRRRLLELTEWLACALATNVLCVSQSIRKVVVNGNICAESKVRLLGSGGSHGVNVKEFDPNLWRDTGLAIRRNLDIPDDALVISFFGRLVREKGIDDLAIAWRRVRIVFPNAYLLLCGSEEKKDPVCPKLLNELQACTRVRRLVAPIGEMPGFFSATDISVLPSYREGLPNVALESAAMKVPIVASRISGCVDAVVEGVTGLLVPPQDSESLAGGMEHLLRSPYLRRRMGEAARQFVIERFSEDEVSSRLLGEYRRLLSHGTSWEAAKS